MTDSDTMRQNYRVLTDADKAEMKFIKEAGEALCNMVLNLQTRRMAEIDKSLRAQAQLAGNNPAAQDNLLRTQVRQAQILRACDVSQQRVEESVMWAIKALTA